MNALEVLKALASKVTLNELRRSSGLSRTQVKVTLESLQAKGLVEFKYGDKWRVTTKGYGVVETLKKLEREKIVKILQVLPHGEGFYFHRDIGQYTGTVATSLSEFHKILEEIEDRSIKFHIDNGDFERWLAHVGDLELAARFREIASSHIGDKALRSAILEAVGRRLETLTLLQSLLG